MYCFKCGAQIPDVATFCPKCGQQQPGQSAQTSAQTKKVVENKSNSDKSGVIAASGVTELKCPGCGAPIHPQIGEMIISCEYCGASISLGNEGWKGIKSNTMLPLKLTSQDQVLKIIQEHMDHGLLHRHLAEKAHSDGLVLSFVPYWIVPVSSQTKYTAVDAAVEIEKVAGTAILAGLLGGAMGGNGGRGGFGSGMMDGMLMGGMVSGGFGGNQGGAIRAYSLDHNYEYPVVAVKGLMEYQPRNYSFNLRDRVVFDMTKVPKGIKVINGDVGEDSAKYEAKTNVDQLQSYYAHQKHHSIRSMQTISNASDPELLHVPVWFAKYDDKGKKIALVIDGESGKLINSIGLT